MGSFDKSGNVDKYIKMVEMDLHCVKVKYVGHEFDFFGEVFAIDCIERGMVTICEVGNMDHPHAHVPRSDLEFI